MNQLSMYLKTYLVILLWGIAAVLSAAELSSPIKILEINDTKVQELLAQEQSSTLSSNLRLQVKEHINVLFDFNELARLTLGSHWNDRSDTEKTHFSTTFAGIIAEQNLTNFVNYYRTGNIAYQSEILNGTQAEVNATVPVRGEPIDLVYLLHTVDGNWRVYDLVIDGLSTATSNRQKFERYINKHSYDKLIQQLEKQLARLQAQAIPKTPKVDTTKDITESLDKSPTVSTAVMSKSTEASSIPTTPNEILDFSLAPGKAGVLSVGMAVDQLYTHFDRTQTRLLDRQQEGKFTPAIALHLNPDIPSATLLAQLHYSINNRWVLGPITISDPRYKTSQGIGVGSTLKQLQTHHVVTLDTSDTHKRLAVEVTGIRFILNKRLADLTGVTMAQLQADHSLLPDSTSILFIYLTD